MLGSGGDWYGKKPTSYERFLEVDTQLNLGSLRITEPDCVKSGYENKLSLSNLRSIENSKQVAIPSQQNHMKMHSICKNPPLLALKYERKFTIKKNLSERSLVLKMDESMNFQSSSNGVRHFTRTEERKIPCIVQAQAPTDDITSDNRNISGQGYFKNPEHRLPSIMQAPIDYSPLNKRNLCSQLSKSEMLVNVSGNHNSSTALENEINHNIFPVKAGSPKPHKRLTNSFHLMKAGQESSPEHKTLCRSYKLSSPKSQEFNVSKESSHALPIIRITALVFLVLSLLSYYWLSMPHTNLDLSNVADEFNISLRYQLYGHTVVSEKLALDFDSFLKQENNRMALILLIGPPGTGKSLTSRILKQHLTRTGFHVSEWHLEKDRLQDFERDFVRSYSENGDKYLASFVEDNGKSLPNIINKVKEILTTKAYQNAYKSIVTIESAMFYKDIQKLMFSHCKTRASLVQEVKDMLDNKLDKAEQIKSTHVHSEFKFVMLPFLLLEEKHVRMCIHSELDRRNIPKQNWHEVTKNVLRELSFLDHCGMKYSETGCKLVSSRVDYVLNR